MSKPEVNRRDFNRLTAAAFGGMVTGSMVGCNKKPAATPGGPQTQAANHICRGLNECKGQGADGKNSCAGAGNCSTVSAHSCAGQNDCKGLGGCGENPGANDCKGKGGCHVPLTGGMWDMARKQFEEKMQAAGKDFSPAPEPPAEPETESEPAPESEG